MMAKAKSEPGPILDIQDARVAEILGAPFNCSVWELARRCKSPASLAEIAALLRVDAASVRLALDELESIGLIARLPAGRKNRNATYRTTRDELVIEYGPSDAKDHRIVTAMKKRFQEHSNKIMDAARLPLNAQRNDEWTFQHFGPARLSPGEMKEFQSMIRGVRDFLDGVSTRTKITDVTEIQDCNVQVGIEVFPIRVPVAPVPRVIFIDRARDGKAVAMIRKSRMSNLSPREREIAYELISGKTRPEIAKQLGISVNTIATISKRIYAKLGVRRRAELGAKLRGMLR
jgi:DNA-binding CsgD family transcriptional regulator